MEHSFADECGLVLLFLGRTFTAASHSLQTFICLHANALLFPNSKQGISLQ